MPYLYPINLLPYLKVLVRLDDSYRGGLTPSPSPPRSYKPLIAFFLYVSTFHAKIGNETFDSGETIRLRRT